MNEPPNRTPASDSSGTEATRPKDLFEASPRSVERIDRVLSLVRREWMAHADERFFQMTTNLASRLGISSYAQILDDDAFIEMLDQDDEIGHRIAEKDEA